MTRAATCTTKNPKSISAGRWQRGLALAITCCAAWTAQAAAPAATTAAPNRPPLTSNSRIAAALAQIQKEDAQTLREQIEIAQIPSPPFKESVRAKDYLRRLQALGLADAGIDSEGNVIARRKGAGGGPTLVLSAHLDTVFPAGTDVTVREKDGRYFGPGFVDDSRGLTVLLTVLRAMQANGIETTGDVLFVGTVGEEGLGDLRGAKALFRDHKDIDGFISVDSVSGKIVNQATGSRRWSATFTTGGGHSFHNFGLPSAIHAMGRAIAKIDELRPPADPKTTFTVGVVSGGTSVNAIAGEAQMQVDIRSNSTAELAKLEQQILAAIDQAVADENTRWDSKETKVQTRLLGDRPASAGHDDTAVVRAAREAAAALKLPPPQLSAASTDANVALSLGIPAATLSAGGRGDNLHSLDEWYEPKNAWLGPQGVLLTVLSLVGVEGVSPPLLERSSARRP